MLLLAWATKNNAPKIKDVLERLEWDRLYHFHNHHSEVTRDTFHDFIGFAVRNGVDQAMFYDSVRNLFMYNDTEYHLRRLQNMSDNHLVDAANELVDKVHLRDKICEIMNLLEGIYFNLFEIDYL